MKTTAGKNILIVVLLLYAGYMTGERIARAGYEAGVQAGYATGMQRGYEKGKQEPRMIKPI